MNLSMIRRKDGKLWQGTARASHLARDVWVGYN
jgi:hypothetical protein